MLGLATSAGKDAWLASLIESFDSVARHSNPLTPAIMADAERHLRENAQGNAAASLLLH